MYHAIHWIMIFPVYGIIQLSNNPGLEFQTSELTEVFGSPLILVSSVCFFSTKLTSLDLSIFFFHRHLDRVVTMLQSCLSSLQIASRQQDNSFEQMEVFIKSLFISFSTKSME